RDGLRDRESDAMSTRLTVERGNAVPAVFDFVPDGVVRLGRETDNTIRIKDRYTSRYHAEIARNPAGVWVFVNLKPTNKTLIDGAPEPLLLIPDGAAVSARLSQRLSAAALQQGKAVWLGGAPTRSVESESLSGYMDAVCVPVFAGRVNAPPLGALHVYRTTR